MATTNAIATTSTAIAATTAAVATTTTTLANTTTAVDMSALLVLVLVLLTAGCSRRCWGCWTRSAYHSSSGWRSLHNEEPEGGGLPSLGEANLMVQRWRHFLKIAGGLGGKHPALALPRMPQLGPDAEDVEVVEILAASRGMQRKRQLVSLARERLVAVETVLSRVLGETRTQLQQRLAKVDVTVETLVMKGLERRPCAPVGMPTAPRSRSNSSSACRLACRSSGRSRAPDTWRAEARLVEEAADATEATEAKMAEEASNIDQRWSALGGLRGGRSRAPDTCGARARLVEEEAAVREAKEAKMAEEEAAAKAVIAKSVGRWPAPRWWQVPHH